MTERYREINVFADDVISLHQYLPQNEKLKYFQFKMFKNVPVDTKKMKV